MSSSTTNCPVRTRRSPRLRTLRAVNQNRANPSNGSAALGQSCVRCTWFGEVSHFRDNQHLQQRGGVTNVPRNGDERVADDGMFFRQSVETIAYKVEFLSLVQNCRRRHCIPDFLRA